MWNNTISGPNPVGILCTMVMVQVLVILLSGDLGQTMSHDVSCQQRPKLLANYVKNGIRAAALGLSQRKTLFPLASYP